MAKKYQRVRLDKSEPMRSTEGVEKESWELFSKLIEETQRRGPEFADIVRELMRLKIEAVKLDAPKYGRGR